MQTQTQLYAYTAPYNSGDTIAPEHINTLAGWKNKLIPDDPQGRTWQNPTPEMLLKYSTVAVEMQPYADDEELRDTSVVLEADGPSQAGTIVTAEELEAERLAAYAESDQAVIDQCALQYVAICTSPCPEGLGADHVLLGPEAIAVGRTRVEAGELSEWEANCIGHELSMYSAVITNLGSNLRVALENLS